MAGQPGRTCKFCGSIEPEGTDVCAPCVKRYLRCVGCGYTNIEYRDGRMDGILARGLWQGMPADCLQCGSSTINTKVKATNLPQANFIKLSGPDSFIRRRICKISD